MWTRKRTVIGGRTQDGDWTVLRNGQTVGRVQRSPDIPGTQPWQWGTLTAPPASGRADSLSEALDAVRTAIRTHWPDSEDPLPLAGLHG